MSQDQPPERPNSESPSEPRPQRPARPSFLTRQTIAVLRGTIRLLEGWVADLESPTTDELSRRPRSILSPLLRPVRVLLPTAWNRQLPDSVLSGALVAIAVLVVWTTNTLFPAPPPEAPEITLLPSPEPVPSIAPLLPEPAPALEPEPAPTESPTPEAEPVAPEPIAEAPPPEPEPTPEPTPELPPFQLSPEQTLIAAIQEDVAEVSDQFVSGLIRSVQANFRGGRLTVHVGEAWYDLTPERQTQLANEMLQRARDLDFSKLEIADPVGAVLARSPVVGTQMIILIRTVADPPPEAIESDSSESEPYSVSSALQ